MAIPDDIDAAIGGRGVVLSKNGGALARVIAFTDQPTVTIERPDGRRETLVLSVFRQAWTVPEPPSEDELARAAQVLLRAGLDSRISVEVSNRIIVSIAHELRAAAGD